MNALISLIAHETQPILNIPALMLGEIQKQCNFALIGIDGLPSDRLSILSIRNFNLRGFKIYFKNEEYDIISTVYALNELLQ